MKNSKNNEVNDKNDNANSLVQMQKLRLELKLPLGNLGLDHILTPMSIQILYAEHHLFLYRQELKFVHADFHDYDFEGKCSSDDNIRLIEIKDNEITM